MILNIHKGDMPILSAFAKPVLIVRRTLIQSYATPSAAQTSSPIPGKLESSGNSFTDLADTSIHSTSSVAPYCLRLRFGSGIIAYTCHSTIVSSDVEFKTTQSFEEREFSTVVLVDGKPVETISGPTDGPDPGPPVGAIVGGVVGGVGAIGLIVLGVFGLRILGRRRSGNQATPSLTPRSPVQEQTHMPNTKAASASSNPPELYG